MTSPRIRQLAFILPFAILASTTPGNSETQPSSDIYHAEACININSAGVEELQEIIHIGPKRAAQIVNLRRQRPFRSVDDLVRVKGIATKRLADIKRQGTACV